MDDLLNDQFVPDAVHRFRFLAEFGAKGDGILGNKVLSFPFVSSKAAVVGSAGHQSVEQVVGAKIEEAVLC
ncbi:hypothetical protein V6N13_143310 [Hibiscus sabdariffa]